MDYFKLANQLCRKHYPDCDSCPIKTPCDNEPSSVNSAVIDAWGKTVEAAANEFLTKNDGALKNGYIPVINR